NESYWRGELTELNYLARTEAIQQQNFQHQLASGLNYLPVGDFSFYDHVLDTSFWLGNLPARSGQGNSIDNYFRAARGRGACGDGCIAGEMTKWFDTNYHYIVPEFTAHTQFSLQLDFWRQHFAAVKNQAHASKPVILGPLSYLWLGKTKDGSEKLHLLERLIPVYRDLLGEFAAQGFNWVQIDEPILALDLPDAWLNAFEQAYHRLQTAGIKSLVTVYFGPLQRNLRTALALPVAGVHLDMLRGKEDLTAALDLLPGHKILSLGVIDGRNIWCSDLTQLLNWLEPVAARLNERLWLAPSCSLLHVPVDLNCEQQLPAEIKTWLSFAAQKLEELNIVKIALNQGRDAVAAALAENKHALDRRGQSASVHKPHIKQAVSESVQQGVDRPAPFALRANLQQQKLQLPLFPTTSIGSFPQTQEIRAARKAFKTGAINTEQYNACIAEHIIKAIQVQEELGMDVLVHGEAERNDMVEYFAEFLQGVCFSEYGWVQSYGSRCVKPPIIYGDIERRSPMTVYWSEFAASNTHKPMKGMLTGPITLLQWSFVRDDQPRAQTALQLALALRAEVQDLERAGINIIQVDEPALREGLPLRKAHWDEYLNWAVQAFKLCVSAVTNDTQIHTHMCYAEFNDILPAIAALDADVITIETSRSDMELLSAFSEFAYPNAIGPGVYDIHSPNLPSQTHMENLLRKALETIPAERLWVNPDCGLKTRGWPETLAALQTMVAAAKQLRSECATAIN
ncbi:MAG TPA: 5-methyltetrahydropteroyltriglutamate--homocysteine S-methyltransferase, partial [Cellvibrionaceae bacterium]|nr:5-methyltetrahydropteroyltriglutamate--homocysteine S-methyltransferase [Cellvibrionaceae bacterium]